MSAFMEYKYTKFIFRSQNDYTHLGLKRDDEGYKLNSITDIIPLIDKDAMRAMIDSEMSRLSEYADLAGLNNAMKSARSIL